MFFLPGRPQTKRNGNDRRKVRLSNKNSSLISSSGWWCDTCWPQNLDSLLRKNWPGMASIIIWLSEHLESKIELVWVEIYYVLIGVGKMLYAQTSILVNLILVKSFSCLVITSQGVGVMTWEFGRVFLTCLLYVPVPIRGQKSSNRPRKFSRGLVCSRLIFV